MESAVAGTSTLNVADAISIGVRHFGQQWIPWAAAMGAVLFLSLVPFITLIPMFGVVAAEDFFDVRIQEGTILGSAFAWIFVLLLCASAAAALVLWLNSVRNAYRQCQGEVITIGSFFALRGLLTPFFTLLSVVVIVGVGLVMFVIPGLIAMVLLMYVPFAAVEPGNTIAEAFIRGWQAFVDVHWPVAARRCRVFCRLFNLFWLVAGLSCRPAHHDGGVPDVCATPHRVGCDSGRDLRQP